MHLLNKAHLDGKSFFLAHASPTGDISKYLNENEIVNELDDIIAEYILIGHTHVQYEKKVDYNLIVNPGSVGLARDGGEACYAIFENGKITLKRINYDVDETIRDLKKAPLEEKIISGLTKVLLHKNNS